MLSPMMVQHQEMKKEYPDCILFFQAGDFYEMFFDDALLVSKELELALTGKSCGLEEKAPMCGVPLHSYEPYLAALIEKGYKVAICDQMEESSATKKLVKREVVRVVTPGTITETNILKDDENNYIASISYKDRSIGLAYCDVSTGEMNITEFNGKDGEYRLINELLRINPKEIISDRELPEELLSEKIIFSKISQSLEKSEKAVLRQFSAKSLTGIGLSSMEATVAALGNLVIYLESTQLSAIEHILDFTLYKDGDVMALDKTTIRNLEITETLFEKKTEGSLLGILDKTHTAMGGRKIRRWLREPLNQQLEISQRLSAVENLIDNYILRNHLKESLKPIYDFERIATKISYGTVNPRDMIALMNSIFCLREIKLDLSDAEAELLLDLGKEIDCLDELYETINTAIVEEAPFSVREGGIINAGYSEELDQLKDSIKDAKTWIAELEGKEKERTGIKNLKVGFNRVFGY
ncbi:MAG: DNA mismatch repair protein MutS, partial [Anaerovoracaceae bacterium]